ncbi:prepilin-type N-terminal cleavage/methylation domain-containing protein [Armatimonas rosea]|uniref:Tfp pilus assembly protein PilV n=1 Tax=Armatimonas rosea TaxID=685828 RepID=A0A7W9W6N3_ARMRO|nr:prepilin-type N-terminal cleavage/methylation domain-containing protein [Armatimonas rosea]MBB6049742.1 Tfp pilus assembly protein PilV [Armatimonas rosea]
MSIRTQRSHHTRRHPRGFTFFEVMLAMMILSSMIVLAGMTLPIMARSVRYASEFNQAQMLVMHKIAQLQEAGYSNIEGSQLNQNGLMIIDGTGTAPLNNANGDVSTTVEFTTTDNLWRYFPGGMTSSGTQDTTSATRPRGYIFIEPFTPSVVTTGSTTSYNLIRVTVTVQWWGWGGVSQMHHYSASTLISKTLVQ